MSLGSPLSCDATGNNCTYERGLQWITYSGTLYYESADCSGDPLISFIPSSAGLEQVGVTVREPEGPYMYLSDPVSRRITVQSVRTGYSDSYEQCYQTNPCRADVTRVHVAIPIDRFGRPPFRWR